MSKFYGNSSDDSSSSDSDAEVRQPARKSAFNKLAAFSSDESSSDESVVRAKPMKKDVFVDILRTIRGHIKNNDYAGLGSDYNDAIKAIEKKGASEEPPKAFIRVLYELNSFISELQASGATKKMSQIKAQAVNKLKAQMNKGNKPYEEELSKCTENPREYDVLNDGLEASDDDSGSESDTESEPSSSESESSDSDSSDSESDSGESSSDESSSDSSSDDSSSSDGSDSSFGGSSSGSESWNMSEESSDEEEDEMARRERRMRRWLKDSDESDYETVRPKAVTVVRKKKEQKKVVQTKDEEGSEDEKPVAVPTGPTAAELTEKELIEKARDLLTSKKLSQSIDQTKSDLVKLDEYISAAKQWGPICQLTFAISTISYVLDARVMGTAYDEFWLSSIDRVKAVVSLLKTTNAYPVSIHELVPEMVVDSDAEAAKRRRVNGNSMISAIAELVDDEFTKSLQNMESIEYAAKLACLPNLVSLIITVRDHLASEAGCANLMSRLSARLLWHMHYQSPKSMELLTLRVPELKTVSAETLSESIFSYGSKKDKASAILLSAFIAASKGDVVKAKRLVSSDLFDLVAVSEISLQIQYNRALAMVGVAAFAAGDVKDCYSLLSDLCTTGRIRELLAQGINRQVQEKTAEADRAERRRLLPYHLHLNIELIESAYYLSSMILEVPHLSRSLLQTDGAFSRRLAKYRRQIESYDRQLFSGPPEFAKDAISLAGKAMMNDDVERAVQLVENLKVWETCSGAKSKIIKLVRIAGIQTYLCNNASSHKNFDLEILSKTFGLIKSEIVATVCRLIVNGDITGKISGNFFVPAVVAVSKVENATQSLADQVSKLEVVSESTSVSDVNEAAQEVVASILAQLNPQTVPGQATIEKEIGVRRVRKAGLSSAKALAATQQAAERRLQAGLAKRRGWDNARGQPLQGQVISTERKKVFGKSYGF
jgi:translation initiation factor 3 subunit C